MTATIQTQIKQLQSDAISALLKFEAGEITNKQARAITREINHRTREIRSQMRAGHAPADQSGAR